MSSLATDGVNTLNKANDIYIAATEATKILTEVAEQFPVIGAVAKLLKNIYPLQYGFNEHHESRSPESGNRELCVMCPERQ